MQSTTLGAAAALAVFAGSYSASLAPLRQVWGHAAAKGAAQAGQAWQQGAQQTQQNAAAGKQVKTFMQFWSDLAPSLLLHGQALSVGVVCAGFSKGALDAYLFEDEQEQKAA